MPRTKENKGIEEKTKEIKKNSKTEVKKAETVKKVKTEKNLQTNATHNPKVAVQKPVKKVNTTETSKEVVNGKVTKKQEEFLSEFYDLPCKYDDTVVKVLAQTPKRLFVYWEVSDKDKQKYIDAFGEDFFERTYPVLLVHNEDLNYTFEIPINDYANSWYLDINDPKTKYVIQLGRKFKETPKVDKEALKEQNINLQNDFIYITDSNKLEAPNDHILFEKLDNSVKYRNVKNGKESIKDISKSIDKLNKVYPSENIEKLYKKLYGEELSDELLHNPSSGNPSSGAISRV